MNTARKKMIGIGCMIGLLIFVLLIGFSYWSLFSNEAVLSVNRKQQMSVSTVFLESLKAKRIDIAQSLVDEKQKQRVGDWIEGRDPVECPIRWVFEPDSWSAASISDDGKRISETRGLRMPCPKPEKMYCLHVEDMVFEKRGEVWIITDWGEINEYWAQFSCGY